MGNFEKLVVLVVLLASAGALAVSLNNSETTNETPSGKENAIPTAPAAKRDAAAKERPQSGASFAASQNAAPKSSLPKLDAGYQAPQQPALGNSSAPSSAQRPNKRGLTTILLNDSGLKPAKLIEDYMTFEPSADDTWMALSQRFYGDRNHVRDLKMANEAVESPADVDMIMVPIYDFFMEANDREAFKPAPALATNATRAMGLPMESSAPAPGASAASQPEGGITYEVVSGDSLSLISKKVYGKASRWGEIFAANRDKMKDENSLKLGMKLYIPKADEFQATSVKDESKVH